MGIESVTRIPQCIECAERWLPMDTDHWQAHWIDDGRDDRLLFYCPDCAEREFGTESSNSGS
jgi:hypothetical protein